MIQARAAFLSVAYASHPAFRGSQPAQAPQKAASGR
jgi:hypothetical protein